LADRPTLFLGQVLNKRLWKGPDGKALVYDAYTRGQLTDSHVEALFEGLNDEGFVKVKDMANPPWTPDRIELKSDLYSRFVRDFGRIWYTVALAQPAPYILVLVGTLVGIDAHDLTLRVERQAQAAAVVAFLRFEGKLY
jgi:hypothetical protein